MCDLEELNEKNLDARAQDHLYADTLVKIDTKCATVFSSTQ